MMPFTFTTVLLLISVVGGLLGAVLGLGGGLLLAPALTLFLGVDIRFAIGASIVSVIATSSGAAAAHVREGLANLWLAMFLELATTSGALTGAFLAGMVRGKYRPSIAREWENFLADHPKRAGVPAATVS